ncbi:hypothetical protein, partial [Klebsiella pneumoniae]|uniref:hypothetical protein n=1 Tax=Klebsiella pneumoniae TaxID=573 RepID=UPI003B9834C0
SFEAARRYIEQAGSRVICLSLLKTILRGYEEITALQPARRFDPYAPNTFTSCQRVIHPYNAGVCDPGAHDEVGDKLDLYDAWTWPI